MNAAVPSMGCDGDYHIEVLDKGVNVVKQVRVPEQRSPQAQIPRDVYNHGRGAEDGQGKVRVWRGSQ